MLCARCAKAPLAIHGIRSVALFEGTVRQAIHRFKYNFAREMVVPLGNLMVDYWWRSGLSADGLVPVPLHRRRRRERGFNQAELLSTYLGREIGLDVLVGALRRTRYTASQTKLGPEERHRNVEGAFACGDAGVAGRRILLVDDVCTTGATLEACSRALMEGGAQSVWALTLARAV